MSKSVRLTVEIDGFKYGAAYSAEALADPIPYLTQSLEFTITNHMERNKED